jgi:outer membrane murein-binding lipoprotein Lpp
VPRLQELQVLQALFKGWREVFGVQEGCAASGAHQVRRSLIATVFTTHVLLAGCVGQNDERLKKIAELEKSVKTLEARVEHAARRLDTVEGTVLDLK